MKKFVMGMALLFCLSAAQSFACTTMLVGKDASADGAVMVSHSDDGLGDGSAIYVPAMNHKPGSKRAVYYSHCALDYK
ncbi:MAG: C69 family dipeptidase, partial [Smithellaceae bacterium]